LVRKSPEQSGLFLWLGNGAEARAAYLTGKGYLGGGQGKFLSRMASAINGAAIAAMKP
jgi:hypothetical protein